ncbi:MAG: hypothetical protein EBX52_06795 [Proteobacteria bacterium]|nr:hypothetical protein [Pseudomonadota bacterium]
MKPILHSVLALTFGFFLLLPGTARAIGDNRFALSGGVMVLTKPSQTVFQIGAEYEHRVDSFIGYGLQGNYLFTTPGIGLLAAPMAYLHPIGTDWFIGAAPLFEFNNGTSVGGRVSTRLPITIGIVSIIPSGSVDFINGRQNFIFGLGVQI